MSRTVGTVYDPRTRTWDLGGGIPDGLEALRQRVQQAVLLRFGEWFLDRAKGLETSLVIGHQIQPALAAQAINDVIMTEGGAEITALRDTTHSVDRTTRRLNYSVRVESIWGDFDVSGEV